MKLKSGYNCSNDFGNCYQTALQMSNKVVTTLNCGTSMATWLRNGWRKPSKEQPCWFQDACRVILSPENGSSPAGSSMRMSHWHIGTMGSSPVVWRGFLCIKLKRHCEHLAELSPEEASALGPVIQSTCLALAEVLKPARVYVCSFGEGVRHVHWWVLPRPADMPPGDASGHFQPGYADNAYSFIRHQKMDRERGGGGRDSQSTAGMPWPAAKPRPGANAPKRGGRSVTMSGAPIAVIDTTQYAYSNSICTGDHRQRTRDGGSEDRIYSAARLHLPAVHSKITANKRQSATAIRPT